jgi:hypothetical protein
VKWRGTLVGSLLLLAVGARPAFAQSDAGCSGDKPWVAVSGQVPAGFAQAVRSDLRAGLAPSGIEVCEAAGDSAPEPLARVVIKNVDGAGARYSLDVTDSVTHKRLGRDLSLENLPPDGRPFALAVAAEELLRASWAELALRGVHSAQTAAPPEVRAIVAEQRRPPPAPRRSLALGARLGFERFLGGQTHYGADLFAVVPWGRITGGSFARGARRALAVDAPHGAIAASALAAEACLWLRFWRSPSLELAGVAGGRGLWLRFEPQATQGSGSSRSGWVVTSRLGLSLAFGKPGVVRSYSALGAGVPLRSFAAADSGVTVTGASRLELFASTGLALELP